MAAPLLEVEDLRVTFRTGVLVGKDFPANVTNWAKETISPEQLKQEFDAVIIAGGFSLVPGYRTDLTGRADDADPQAAVAERAHRPVPP